MNLNYSPWAFLALCLSIGNALAQSPGTESLIKKQIQNPSTSSVLSMVVSPLVLFSTDSLRISEIMYNPPESGSDIHEYIEIHNPTANPVNLKGVYFSAGVSYTFSSYVLPANGYVVVCEDSVALNSQFGTTAFQWTGVLNNGGEEIVLKDSLNRTIDSVEYDNSGSWPSVADGDGPSIVLCDLSLDPNDGSSWQASGSGTGNIVNGFELIGSPGAPDVACGACVVDSTTERTLTCDSTLAGTFIQTYTGSDGCDSVVTNVKTYQPSTTTPLAGLSVCEGDSVLVFGTYQRLAGVYYDTLHSNAGCDSLVSIAVSLLRSDTVYNTATTTDSTLSGVFDTTYINQAGCDSVVITTVTYMADPCSLTDSTFLNQVTCDSSQVGVTVTVHTNRLGCDSVVTTTSVFDPGSFVSLADAEICEGDSSLIFGIWQSTPGVYYDSLKTQTGCDSILKITLQRNLIDTSGSTSTTSNPAAAGIFTTSFTNAAGCDSVVIDTILYNPLIALESLRITEIMYNPPEPGSDVHEYIEIYNPSAVPVNLNGFSFSQGVNLTFGNVIIPSMGYVVACEDSMALFTQFGASGYEWTGALTNGGEDIVLKDSNGQVLDSVRYSNSGSWPSEADDGGASIVLCDLSADQNDGGSWLASGSATGNFVNGYELKGSPGMQDVACGGCVTVDSVFLMQVSCDSLLAGSTTVTLTNALGCDSVVVTYIVYDSGDLTQLPAIEICDGEETMIFGMMRDSAGIYYDTLQNSNGCDSILIQELIIKSTYSTALPALSICNGDSTLIFGQYQSTPGTYSDTLTALNGCDSVLLIDLVYRSTPLCDTTGGDSTIFSIVSDSSWTLSTVVTLATSNSYPWPGVAVIPDSGTFTLPVTVGQPYPWEHIWKVPGSEVITALSGVTYYRNAFYLTDSSNMNVRFRMRVDDNMQIFINGQWIAMEDDMGPDVWRGAGRDLLFRDDGTVVNGYSGGNAFAYVTNVDMEDILRIGPNDIVLAIRNRSNRPDRGGFSFRLDMDKNGQGVIVKKSESTPVANPENNFYLELHPNPAGDYLEIATRGMESERDCSLTISDINGRVISRMVTAAHDEKVLLDLSDYAPGVYLLKANIGEEIIVKRFIKH